MRERLPSREDLPDIDRQTALALFFVAILIVAPVGFAIAQTLTHQSTAGVSYQTNSGMTVTLEDPREVPAVPFADDQTFADGDLTISGTGGDIGIGDDTYAGDSITVFNVDTATPITVARSDTGLDFTVESGDASQLQVRDYALDNGTADIAYASTNGVTITLDDLPAVGVAAVDASTGDVLDDDTVGTTGDSATLSLPGGTRQIELKTVPSELQVRNEAKPDELIDENVELRARFFADDTVVERNVTDGTVSLDGLPADQEIVVTVKEANANFTYRRILIENIVETSEIYLLPTTEPSAEIRFQLNDQTGRFDADSTKLFVEKPITRNGSTTYRTISGDRIGADGEFPTILIDAERYRIRVQNSAGEKRVLGAYTVQGAEVAPLTIGEVRFEADADSGPAMQASLREAPDGATHNHEARIVYVDPEGETDSIEVSISNETGAPIRPTTTETLGGSTDAYVETYPLNATFDPEEDTATVTVTATRGVETETFERVIGDVPDVFPGAPIDQRVLELMGFVSILGLVGLLVIVNPPLAAIVGAGYAGLLSLVGVVPIPMPFVVVAGLVGILVSVGTDRGGL